MKPIVPIVALVVNNANPTDARLSKEYDEALERIVDNLDNVVKYAGIERQEILQFIRRKFYYRNQPFASSPHLDWTEKKNWALEPLRQNISVSIGRIPNTSEYDKYILLAKLYGRVRDRMLPQPVYAMVEEG